MFAINFSAQTKVAKFNIVGDWNWTDYWENKSDFILSSDNYVSMSINGEFIDGKKFVVRGGKNNGKSIGEGRATLLTISKEDRT